MPGMALCSDLLIVSCFFVDSASIGYLASSNGVKTAQVFIWSGRDNGVCSRYLKFVNDSEQIVNAFSCVEPFLIPSSLHSFQKYSSSIYIAFF